MTDKQFRDLKALLWGIFLMLALTLIRLTIIGLDIQDAIKEAVK